MPVAEGKEGETKNEVADKKEHKPETKQAKSRSSSPTKSKGAKAGKSKPLGNAAEPKQSTATTSRPTAESKAKSAKSKTGRTRNAANSASSRASASSTASEAKATTGTAPLLNLPAGRVPTSKPAPGASWRDRLKSPTAGAASKAPAAQAMSNRNSGTSASPQTSAKSPSDGRGGSGAWCCFSPLVCSSGGFSRCCSRNSTLETGPPDPDARDSPGCASREGCVLLWCNSESLGSSCHTIQYACCAPLACAQRGALGFGHACLVGWGDLGCGDQCCGAWAVGSGLRNPSTPMPPLLLLSSKDDAAAAATSTDPNVVARNALLKGLAGCARPDDVGGVRVLGTDRPLLDDVALLHPVVRLHAVNIHTGHYLQWQPPAIANNAKDSSSAGHATPASNKIVGGGATLLWERGEGDSSDGRNNSSSSSNRNAGGLQYGAPLRAVAPVVTHPFPLRRRMEAPRWGVDDAWGHGQDSGELLLDAPYTSLLHPDCLLLVELVDFGCAGRPVGGAKGRKPYSAHHHPHGSSGNRVSGLTGGGGDDDDEDDDDIDDDEGPLGAGAYSGPGMRLRGNSLNRSGHHHHHSSGGGGGHLAAASTVGRSGPSPKGTAAARVRKGQGYTGVCWGFLKPIGRGGRPTVGVRGSNLGEAAWGATPRTELDVGGVGRLGSGSNNQPNSGQEGNNNDSDDGSSDVARLDRRVSLQLFRWQELGPVALAQAIARGLAPLPAPAASPVPLVYLQWLLRARRYYPATLTIRVGPVPRNLALRRCGAGRTGGGWHHVRSAFLSGSGLGLLGGKRAHLEALQLGGGGRDDNDTDGRFPSLEAAAGNNGMSTTGASGATSASMLGSGDEPMEPHVLARAWQPGERCAVPDRLMARCVLGGTLNGGTTALAFSHSGRFLAVAAVAASSDGASGHSSGGTGGVSGVPLHPLLIFDVNKEDGRTVLRGPPLVGHVGVVHALAWSHDDKFLLSASSDGTARVWNMARITHRRKMEQEARAAAQAHALADAQAIAQKFMEADESKAAINDENNASAANSISTRKNATRNGGGAPTDSVTDDDAALDHTANDEGAALLQPPPMRRAGSMSGGVPSTATASVTEDEGGNSTHSSSFGAGNEGGLLVRILAHSPPAFIHAAAFLPTLASESKSAGGSSAAPGSPNTATSSPRSPKSDRTTAKVGAASSNSVPLFLRGCPRVVTCASDGSVRLWDPTAPEHPDLGLFGGFRAPLHRRGATAVAVDTVSRRVYSADADGAVWPWVSTSGLNTPSSPTASPTTSPQPSSGNGKNDATSTPQSNGGGASYCPDGRPLSHSMLRGRCVTSLALQPSRRNPRLRQYAALNSGANNGATNGGGGGGGSARHMLVAAQGNVLLLFDLGARALLATYLGASIRTSPIKACFSPDGCFVLCGSEEGSVSVWNAENDPRATLPALPPASVSPSPRSNTGAANSLPTRATNPLVASMPRHPSSALTTMAFNAPMLCVAWNPVQHAVALGAAGGPYPVLLACTDKPLDDDSDDVMSFPVGTLGGGGGPSGNRCGGGFTGGMNGNGGEEEEEDARVIAARLNLAKRMKVRAKLDEAKAARAAIGNAEASASGGGLANDLITPRRANRTALLPETAEGFTFGGGGGGNGAPSVVDSYTIAAEARDGFLQGPSSSAVDLMSRTAPLPNEVPNLQIPSMSKTTNDALDAASF